MKDVKSQERESSLAIGHETVAQAQLGKTGACSGECIPEDDAGTAGMDKKSKKLRIVAYQRVTTEMMPNPAVNPAWLKDYEHVLGTKRGSKLEELFPMRIWEE